MIATVNDKRQRIAQYLANKEELDENYLTAVYEYFKDVDETDLQQLSSADWAGVFISHLHLGYKRQPNELNIRTYNPNFDDNKWAAPHTAIEITSDDCAFLVDTAVVAINRLGYGIHQIIHPILLTQRDAATGKIKQFGNSAKKNTIVESWIHLQIDRISCSDKLTEVTKQLTTVFEQLQMCVADVDEMRAKSAAAEQVINGHNDGGMYAEYLQWLRDDNFIFLGYQYIHASRSTTVATTQSLGFFRHAASSSTEFVAQAGQFSDVELQQPVVLVKSTERSSIHRDEYFDCVVVKDFVGGKVIGEHQFIGLYTAKAFNTSPRLIPIIREKIQRVIVNSNVGLDSHIGKSLRQVFETYPRDELRESSDSDLLRNGVGIAKMQERRLVRVFTRIDGMHRYISFLVYLPRDNVSTDVRERIRNYLEQTFAATHSEFEVSLGRAVLARIHFVVYISSPAVVNNLDSVALQEHISEVARSWTDDLRLNLVNQLGEEVGLSLFNKYSKSLPADYKAAYNIRTAVSDIVKCEKMLANGDVTLKLTEDSLADGTQFRLKILYGKPIPLSHGLPVLENMGVHVSEEYPFSLEFDDGGTAWISDIAIQLPSEGLFDGKHAKEVFQQGFAAVYTGKCENDVLNALILHADMSWCSVALLRCYSKYMRQIGLTYSERLFADTLIRYKHTALDLLALFDAQHNPKAQSTNIDAIIARIADAITATTSIDDETILHGLLECMQATLRTNYFQSTTSTAISIKLAPQQVARVPEPKPLYEIFVYAPTFEGIHLRFGKVARGGLRWSDRREDFRTEVLGLVKAQQVKNTVIVPVGSKGGFVVKQPAADRDAYIEQGKHCYTQFVCGLLDLTDNVVNGKVVHPKNTICLDEADPYLVVAADKGTATFSDLANSVAQQYGFWLDDAFASGGSVGYDHKKMGITARGVWESVKRHFRERGINIQTTPFSVIAIGDMMGDVFGNGMLQSEHIKLIAAFNHQHIFIDPSPDIAVSFAERKRIFALPRSSWDDYDTALLSTGGGVYKRGLKSISLAKEARIALGISKTKLTPNQLIHLILQAPVDLLYNGGIGTYFKASYENQADANDRSNDMVRVNANEIGAKVIGEGGNLGLTQLARIEYAQNGGSIYTDAIDNSAGVDCSDHEVNYKILLNSVVAQGEMTNKQRNRLLAELTNDVAVHVLRDNYQQTAALSLENWHSQSLLSVHKRFIQHLENAGLLNRAIEFLPSNIEINARSQRGLALTSPELAVVLAYAKLQLYQQLLAAADIEPKQWHTVLIKYFPATIRKRFATAIIDHPLHREIIVTQLSNICINRMGTTFVFRLAEEMKTTPMQVVNAWYMASELISAIELWHQLKQLDNVIDTEHQYALMLDLRRTLEWVVRWLLKSTRISNTSDAMFADFAKDFSALLPKLYALQVKELMKNTKYQRFRALDIDEQLLYRICFPNNVLGALQMIQIAQKTNKKVEAIAQTYFAIENVLCLGKLSLMVNALPRTNRWETVARLAFRDEIRRAHSAVITAVVADKSANALENWQGKHATSIRNYLEIVEEISSSEQSIAMVIVAIGELKNLVAP